MNSNGIEDILIGRDYNKKKKKNKGFFIVFFMLFLILAGFVGAYWYLTQDVVSSKELFVQNVSKININKLLKNEIYTSLASKLQKESSQIDSSINFTTDLENEELQDIDITKFKLDISNSNDVINKKNYAEAILNYSGNEVLKVNLAASENEIALSSNEILDKYVGIHLDKIKDIFGIDIDINGIKELNETENIDIKDDEINEYTKKYFEIILNNISDEKFSVQENIAIENATEDVEVTNYSVTLTQDELNAILVSSLEELKNDDELINKLILISEEENKTITPTNIQNNNSQDNQTNNFSDVEENSGNEQTNDGTTDETTDESQTEEPSLENGQEIENTNNPEENLQPEIPVIQINPVGTISVNTEDGAEENQTPVISVNESQTLEGTQEETTENATSEIPNNENQNSETTSQDTENIETIETTDIDELIKQEHKLEDQIIRILLGKKVNLNKEQFKNLIDELIKEVQGMSGNGIKINVYASPENVEKINLVLPNDDIVDLDFFPDENPELNSNQSYIKITYLNEDENSEKNGFSLEINKEQSNASTIIDSVYSFIENEKINKKIKLNLKTEGTVNSKELKNDIVFTISTNKSETQVAVDNTIQFKEVSDLPGLNSENCIYLDLLPEAERQSLIDTIKTQITTLYTNKKENLNFIDTNTYSQTTLENQNQTATSTVTREEAKNALINKVTSMMDEAILKNEEFTIQNLVDLKIDGYKVSSAVTSEAALIVVDVYKFNIDTSFTLTDVE